MSNLPYKYLVENYLKAEDKRVQIFVLAELEDTTPSEIVDFLRFQGVEVPESYKKPLMDGVSVEDYELIVRMREEGRSKRDIHDTTHFAVSTIDRVLSYHYCETKKPKQRKPVPMDISDADKAIMDKFMIGDLEMAEASEMCGVAPSRFYRMLRKAYGSNYISQRRENMVRRMNNGGI